MLNLIDYIIAGGYTMVPLLICSIVAVGVAIDRAWAFLRYARIDNRALRAKVLEHLAAGRIGDAARLCAATPGPVSAVLLVGLKSYARHKPLNDRPESLIAIMEKSMLDYAEHAVAAVERRLPVLLTIGNAAPLLGMTGTVLGMIGAFGTIKRLQNIDAAAVGGDISVALITTAAGLIIALIAVVPWSYFNARADAVALEIEEARAELLDFVATRVEREHPRHNDQP